MLSNTHQRDKCDELILQALVIIPQTEHAVLNGVVHFERPVDLSDAQHNLSGPLFHPVLAGLFRIRLEGEVSQEIKEGSMFLVI